MLSIDRPVLEMCYLLGLADPGRSSGEKRNAWSIVLSETVLVIESRQPCWDPFSTMIDLAFIELESKPVRMFALLSTI